MSLPLGSAYRGAVNPTASWSEERYQIANVLDALLVINWRLMGCPSRYTPEPVERPGDKQRQLQAIQKAKSVRQRIENTRWKEA